MRAHKIWTITIICIMFERLKTMKSKQVWFGKSNNDQPTRFKAIVAVGDENGHVGLGVKC